MVKKTWLLRCSALIGALLLVAGSFILPASAESMLELSHSYSGTSLSYSANPLAGIGDWLPPDWTYTSGTNVDVDGGSLNGVYLVTYQGDGKRRVICPLIRYRFSDGTILTYQYSGGPAMDEYDFLGRYDTSSQLNGSMSISISVSFYTFETVQSGESGDIVRMQWTGTSLPNITMGNAHLPNVAPRYFSTDEELALAVEQLQDYLQNPDSSTQSDVERHESDANSIDEMFGDYVDQMSTPPIPDVSVVTSNADISAAGGLFGSLGGWITSLPGVATICGVAVSCWVLALILYGVKGG